MALFFAFLAPTLVFATTPELYYVNRADYLGSAHLPNGTVNTPTGAFTYRYPLTLPPGRNGLQSDIAFQYNSQNDDQMNWIGYGWDVNIPSISRLNKTGVDRLYTDNFFTSAVSGELVSSTLTDAVHGTYAAKIEDGSFLVYTFNTDNSWTVTDKRGTRYTYGSAVESRQTDPDNASRIFGWMISEIRDTNNNFISFEYTKDYGEIYPYRITYSGHDVTPGIITVTFSLQSRGFDLPLSVRTGFIVSDNYRISRATVAVNGMEVRRYDLAFIAGDNSVRTLLQSITETGTDEAGVQTVLPPTTFTYQNSNVGWYQDPTYSANLTDLVGTYGIKFTTVDGKDGGLRMADVNGDAYIDLIHGTTVYQGSVNGGWVNVGGSVALPAIENGKPKGVSLADVTGDGLPDLLHGEVDGPPNVTYREFRDVHINMNNPSWPISPSYTLPTFFIDHRVPTDFGARLGDLNGDGLLDISWGLAGSAGADPNIIYLHSATTTGWVQSTTMIPPSQDFTKVGGRAGAIRLIDANADGLDDYISTASYNYIYNGISYVLPPGGGHFVYGPSQPFTDAGDNDRGVREMDVNGDGLVDLVSRRNYGLSEVYINHGPAVGWVLDSSFLILAGNFSFIDSSDWDTGLRIADINADGMQDLIMVGQHTVHNLNTGRKPDILTQIQNSQGAVTTVSYQPSSKYVGSISPLSPNLPFVIYTVREITTNDGLGHIAHTLYTYEGGKMYYNNPHDRKFAGFQKVTAQEQGRRITKTYFHQGDDTNSALGEFLDTPRKIGRVYRTEILNETNQLQTAKIDRWEEVLIGTNGRYFVKQTQSTSLLYNAQGQHQDMAETVIYNDTNGNTTEKTALGEVRANSDGTFTDVTGDDIRTMYTYATDPGGIIRGLSSIEEVRVANTRQRYIRHYYDNQILGSVTVGNETKTERLMIGSGYEIVNRTYTAQGLLASETGPNGNQTTYGYDAFSLYPISVTNALAQTTQYVYDYSLGKPKTVIDPNGYRTETIYDGFDRAKELRESDTANPASTILSKQFIYTDVGFPRSVRELSYLDSDVNAVESITYLDANNKPIQMRKESNGANIYTVFDSVYDAFGRKVADALPYEATGLSYTTPTTNANLLTTYVFDAVDRPVSVVTNLGVTLNQYLAWTTTTTDPLGNVRAIVNDPHGRILEAREKNGSALYRTRYTYANNLMMTRLTDALNSLRNFTYDLLSRRTRAEDLHTSSDSSYGITTSSYDNASNLTLEVTPLGDRVAYTYDALNRVAQEIINSSTLPAVLYTYDSCTNGIGRLCQVASSAATTTYAYDVRGRVVQETRVVNGQTFITANSYNRQGNVVSQVVDNRTTAYAYNNAGQVQSVTENSQPIISSILYAPIGQVAAMTYANGVQTTNTYNPAERYRLTNKQTVTSGGTLLQQIAYVYDAVGNITTLTDTSQTASAKTATYTYDPLYRLTQAAITGVASGTAPYIQNFTYNAVGNILTSPVGSYTYAGNSIAGSYANPHAATTIAGTTITYDRNGNMLNSGVANTYVWDYKNRLTQASATSTNAITRYAYDQTGQRVKMTAADTTVTLYPSKYLEVTTSTITKRIYLGDQEAASMVTTIATGLSTTTFNHTDHLNSTSVVTNGSGNIVEAIDYYPYGDIRFDDKIGSTNEKRKFIGQFYDEGTGLSYLNARYYDGKRGQFLSEDPVHLALGYGKEVVHLVGCDQQKYLTDVQSLNSYMYGKGNPIQYSDPSGNATYIWDNGAGMTGVDTWDHNIYYQSQDQRLLQHNATLMSLPGNYANLVAFYNLVRNRAEWDYKNQDRGYYFYENDLVDKETFGNRNYGNSGTATGFGSVLLKVAAGYAQIRSGNARLKDVRTFFDDGKDTANIQIGISTYNTTNKANPASLKQIVTRTTVNKQTLTSIYGLVNIKGRVGGLVKRLSK